MFHVILDILATWEWGPTSPAAKLAELRLPKLVPIKADESFVYPPPIFWEDLLQGPVSTRFFRVPPVLRKATWKLTAKTGGFGTDPGKASKKSIWSLFSFVRDPCICWTCGWYNVGHPLASIQTCQTCQVLKKVALFVSLAEFVNVFCELWPSGNLAYRMLHKKCLRIILEVTVFISFPLATMLSYKILLHLLHLDFMNRYHQLFVRAGWSRNKTSDPLFWVVPEDSTRISGVFNRIICTKLQKVFTYTLVSLSLFA